MKTSLTLSALGLLTACSIVNAPDDVQPGGDASGGSGNTGNASTGGNGNGGTAGAGGDGAMGGTGGEGPPVCGDGVLQMGEACDDGNTADGDACSADCATITEFDVAGEGNEWPGVGTSGVDGGKGFYVAFRQNGSGALAIMGRAYSAGGTPEDEAQQLSVAPNPGQSRIGTNASGRSVVAWPEQGAASSVHYRIVGPNGIAEGTDLVVPTSSASGLISVGTSTTDEFALVWNFFNLATDTQETRVRALDATGTPAGSQQFVGPSSGAFPGVWGVSVGFVAAWTEPSGILRGIQLTKSGAPLSGTQFQLSSESGVSSNNPFGAFVGPQNQFIAVFEQPVDIAGVVHTRIKRRRFDDLGSSAELDQVVSAVHTEEYHSRVARHASGNFVVVWASDFGDCDIFARVFASNGNAVGDPFQVNQMTAGCQSWPGVAVNEDGDAMFVWDNYPAGGFSYRISAVIYPRLLD